MSRLQAALADARWLVEHWPWLAENRLPGSPRPWRQTDLGPEQRAELDARARVERLERAEVAPGETPPPVHVDVLDVLSELTVTAEQLADQAVAEVACRLILPPAPSAYADPRSYLVHVSLHLHEVDHDLIVHAADRLAALRRDAATALRLVYDGQRLAADCPWCGQPRALVVRVPAADQLPMLIVCESGRVCEPGRDSGTQLRGRPAWPEYEWDWLAGRIRHIAAHQAPPATAQHGRSLKIAHQPAGCWIWQGAHADLPAPDTARSCGQELCTNPTHLQHADEHRPAC